jgi:D-tyrosyl-tRNA(Tyr) deacylase
VRAVTQRVKSASVWVEEALVGRIGRGLLVYIGIGQLDQIQDAAYMAKKISGLRIFEDECGKMNRSVLDVKGEILIVSQFTLYGDLRHGRRPGFAQAAGQAAAAALYEAFVEQIRYLSIPVQTGIFQARMLVQSENDGPVTFMLDSQKVF